MEFRRRLDSEREAVTLRLRLFLLVAGLVATTVGVVTWIVSDSARRAFEASDRQRASAQISQIRREFDRQGEDLAYRVERIVASDSFQRTALEIGRRAGDYSVFLNDAAAFAASQSLDIFDLVTDDGTIVSSAEWPARFGYKNSWVVGGASSPAFLQSIELPREVVLALVVVRRFGTSSRAIWVAGGRRLDQSFLKSLALPDGLHAWLYQNLEPETARQRLLDASGDAPQAAPLEPLIARVRQSSRETAETIEWPEGPEQVNAIPLNGREGAVLGVLLLGSSGRELTALVSSIRWSGAAIGAAGLALGLALSYILAARITQPIEQLAGAAHDVAEGKWVVPAEGFDAPGEVGALARAFETMTRQLADQRDRLVQAERVAAWRELARRLAHELKNPLFPLRLTVDNLRRARSLPPAEFAEILDECLTTLDTGLANLNTVVGRFSDFSKMPPPEFDRVSPNAIVERVIAMFRSRFEAPDQPRIAVALDLDPASTSIVADGEQIGRVVQNLILNAIDAMPRGGTITITTRAESGVFRLTVGDTGEGLTAEECTRLFTPYYTTKQHGTGLGLAIVQSVVADHRGKVWVQTAPGRGSTFYIEVPVERPAA